MTEWTEEELEDLLTDAVTDSLELDSTQRDAAKLILKTLRLLGLEIRRVKP